MRVFVIIVCCTLLFLASCKKDPEVILSLDEQLIEQMIEVSDNGTLDFFTLPNDESLLVKYPQDPRNSLSNDKIKLGRFLFHETNMAIHPKYAEGLHTYSCASCHHAAAGFQSGVKQGIGEGGSGFGLAGETRIPDANYVVDSIDIQPVRTPSAMNGAYQTVNLWNGQFGATGPNAGTESQWTTGTPKENNHLGYEGLETQAIAGLTVHRMGLDEDITANPAYQEYFSKAFPEAAPDELFSLENAGLAIAAFERIVVSNEAPFQKWLQGDYAAMTDRQKEGALLFFGKAKCTGCHTGPALNSMEFHAIGMHDLDGPGVYGTFEDDMSHLGRGSFTGNPEDNYKFKVPQLYNLKDGRFYGHGASFDNIRDLMVYKNEANAENLNVPANQLSDLFEPLNLNDQEIDLLTEFLEEALYDNNLDRYVPEMLPSGYCFPNGDLKSKKDLGCN